MFLPNKKFIAALILFLVCFEIFFYSIPQTNPVLAQSKSDEALIKQYKQPAPNSDQGRQLQKGGGGEDDKVSGLPGTIVLAATVIMNILGSFAGWIISIEAGILNWILNPDNIRMATAPIVVSGWDVTRTTVNMFFVLVLLVVAFATILRIETYNLKAILPRLIIVALLINFSLVIAGAILDFSNVMTKYFYTSATKSGSDIAMAIQNGLKLTNFYKSEEKTTGGGFAKAAGTLLGFTSVSISVFVYALLSTLFCIAAIFIFLALIIMMLIRVIYIWVLLILAPAAWFFYIIPAWQSQWYKWWSNFFRWAFFAPIAMFFIFLSITTMTNLGKERSLQGRPGTYKDFEIENLKAEAQKTTVGQPNAESRNLVEAVFQSFIGMGLLLGSLMAANSMSITGAGMATSLGKNMGTGMARWTGRRLGRSMTWGSKYDEKGNEVKKSYFERGLGKLAKAPIIGQLARPGFAALERQKGYIQGRTKKYEGYSSERLDTIYDRLSKEDQMAVNLIRMKRGEFNKLSDKDKLQALNLAQKYGFSKERQKMLKFDPNMVFSLTKDPAAQTALLKDILTTMKADDWKDMSNNLWSKPGITKFVNDNLTKSQIATMMPNLSFEGREKQKEYLKSLLTPSEEDTIKLKVESEIATKGLKLTDEEIKKMINRAIANARIDKYETIHGTDKADYLRSTPGRNVVSET